MLNICYMSLDVFTKYAWIKALKDLKDKKGKTVLNAFIKVENETNCKPNKLWVGQGRMQEWPTIMIFQCTPHTLKVS